MDPYSRNPASDDQDWDMLPSPTREDEFDPLERENDAHPSDSMDLYAILNVDRKASDEDIKNAYRRLCITFHPDKFTDEEAKEAASRKFVAIQKAYDVLSDTSKRYMYDLYGADGIDGSWDIGPKLKSKEEIREEFERRTRIKKEMDIQNLVRSRGEVTLGVDVSSYFIPELWEPSQGLLDLIRMPELTRASVVHSWEAQMSQTTRGTIQGVAAVSNGMGGANVTFQGNHAINSNLFVDGNLSIGNTPSASVKLTRNFGSDINTHLTANVTSLYRLPTLSIYVGRNLSSNSMGYVVYQPGMSSLASSFTHTEPDDDGDASYTMGYIKRYPKSRWDYVVSAGVRQSSVAVTYIRSMNRQLRTRFSTQISTATGITSSFGGDKKLNQTSRIGMSVEYSNVRGVSLRLWFVKLGQKFSVPILLTPQPDLKIAILGFFGPLLTGYGIDYVIFRPWRKNARYNKIKQMREERTDVIQKRKKEAEEAVELMRDAVTRKHESEVNKDGLVVLEALYGKLPETSLVQARRLSTKGIQKLATSLSERLRSITMLPSAEAVAESDLQPGFIDVTLAVQSFVQNSQLYIGGGYSKSNLLGFWDPCLGESKQLRVTYQFQGRLHVVEVGDKEAIAAPLRGHTI